MVKIFYALTLTVAFCSDFVLAQEVDGRFQKQLQPMIEQVMQQQNIPGLAIAIVENQKVVYAKGFGVKNLDGKNEKITPQSLFHMASITKPFVATSIMQRRVGTLCPQLERFIAHCRAWRQMAIQQYGV
ncbi:beta-lactamase family protein [candidate division KSB1 bacterium]|nr:beta-lactamase family protein [candidate division KSB1 bacterium]